MNNQSNEFYEQFAGKYDLMISEKRYDSEIPFFQKIFEKYSVRTILDCACGTGRHAIKFAGLGLEVSGCDFSPDMVTIARDNAVSSGMDIKFIQADFKNLSGAFSV